MLTPLSNKAAVSSEHNKRRSACIVCIEGGLWPEGISRKGQGKAGLIVSLFQGEATARSGTVVSGSMGLQPGPAPLPTPRLATSLLSH